MRSLRQRETTEQELVVETGHDSTSYVTAPGKTNDKMHFFLRCFHLHWHNVWIISIMIFSYVSGVSLNSSSKTNATDLKLQKLLMVPFGNEWITAPAFHPMASITIFARHLFWERLSDDFITAEITSHRSPWISLVPFLYVSKHARIQGFSLILSIFSRQNCSPCMRGLLYLS